MYQEIKELSKYCEKIGVKHIFESFLDGYAIRFNNGGDFVQHRGSYGNKFGCVEPAGVSKRLDYTAVKLKNAKRLVKVYKNKLNGDEEK
jgi:hypothetical protein